MEDKYRAFSSSCEHAERVSKTGSDIDVVEFSDQMADFFGSKLKGQMTNASVPTTAASSAIGGRQRHFVFGGAQSYGGSSSFGFSQGLIAEKPAEEPKLSEFAAENWRQDIELCSPQQEAFAATPSSHAFTGGAFGFGVRSPASFGEAQQRAALPHASPLSREIVRCLGMVRRSPVADQVPREGVIVADVHGKVKMRPRQMNSQAQNQNPEHVHCLIGKDLTDIRGIFASPGNR
ncbi:hypothetical protein BaRGS_00035151 [Batillaria attramentaria]|uniref:Uncharacterized protein n=1 Tax=Batillaria attramentaria TaxID=370345 RepID=A0ABD0JEX8_9CAEN